MCAADVVAVPNIPPGNLSPRSYTLDAILFPTRVSAFEQLAMALVSSPYGVLFAVLVGGFAFQSRDLQSGNLAGITHEKRIGTRSADQSHYPISIRHYSEPAMILATMSFANSPPYPHACFERLSIFLIKSHTHTVPFKCYVPQRSGVGTEKIAQPQRRVLPAKASLQATAPHS